MTKIVCLHSTAAEEEGHWRERSRSLLEKEIEKRKLVERNNLELIQKEVFGQSQ